MKTPRSKFSEARAWRELRDWTRGTPGRLVTAAEKEVMDDILPDLFGYHLVQIGERINTDLTAASRISHKVIFRIADSNPSLSDCAVITNSDALPLAAMSVDVVVLPHVLEFSPNPHAVLREVERVLIGDGHAAIISFNPISFYGLWHLFLAWKDQAPWNGHYYSLVRLKDWLTLLGFDIVYRRKFFFRPPCRSDRVNERLRLIEKMGAHCWPFFGGITLLVAKKRVLPLTPVKALWKQHRRLIATGAAEPTARVHGRKILPTAVNR